MQGNRVAVGHGNWHLDEARGGIPELFLHPNCDAVHVGGIGLEQEVEGEHPPDLLAVPRVEVRAPLPQVVGAQRGRSN